MKVNFRSHGHVQVFGGTGCHPDWAGAELRGAAAAVGCGLQPEPCRAAVSLPQGTRAQPELPLEPGVGTAAVASAQPPPATTSSGHRAEAGQGSPGCCSMWEPEPARTGNLAGSFSRGRWRTHFFYSPNSTFLLQRINPITKSWNQRLRRSQTRQASLGKCWGHANLLRALFTWRILLA